LDDVKYSIGKMSRLLYMLLYLQQPEIGRGEAKFSSHNPSPPVIGILILFLVAVRSSPGWTTESQISQSVSRQVATGVVTRRMAGGFDEPESCLGFFQGLAFKYVAH
jgi:hypothetical protein